MNKKSIFLSIFVSIIIIGIGYFPAKGEYEKQAQILADSGIINNQKANPSNYKTLDNITRGEMLKIMLNLAGLKPNTTCTNKFSDINSTSPNNWVCFYAEKALENSLISNNKNFRPNDKISKSESLKMIMSGIGIKVDYKNETWQQDFVTKALNLKLIDKQFQDFNNSAIRGFIFNIAANAINNTTLMIQTSQSCISTKTYAIENTSKKCVVFPNTCIPKNYTKSESCLEEKNVEKQTLKLSFSDNMNQKSVEENLKIYPELKYETIWTDKKNLELVIDDEINTQMEVLVNILDKASYENDKKIENTISKKFKLEAHPKINFITPVGKITDVKNYFTINFSSPVIALTNLENQTICPIEFTPKISGKCVWITTSTVQFRPENNLPLGAKYSILVGDKFVEKPMAYEVETPEFKLEYYKQKVSKKEELTIKFNDKVDIEKIKNNFNLATYNNNDLNFSYYLEDGKVDETIINILPKSGNWGGEKKLLLTIYKNITSNGGNITLQQSLNLNIEFLGDIRDVKPFIFKDLDSGDLYNEANFKYSIDNNVIQKDSPNILFSFYEKTPLDKNLFQVNGDFEIHYATNYDNETKKNITDENNIVLTLKGDIKNNITIKVKDKTYNYTLVGTNKISVKPINYSKFCLTSTMPIQRYSQDIDNFVFDGYARFDSFNLVEKNDEIDGCPYQANGGYNYIAYTKLNPNSKYNLTIKKELLSSTNAKLENDYKISFTTPKAENIDKSVQIISDKITNIVPTSITPLSIGFKSVNIDKFNIEACIGDIGIEKNTYITNTKCKTQTLKVSNLGFKPNISVFDISKILGITNENLEGKAISIKTYLTKDDVNYDGSFEDYIKQNNKTFYYYGDIQAVLKTNSEGFLWLYNTKTGENINNEIEKISSFTKQNDYDLFGNYTDTKIDFKENIDFSFENNGIYKLSTLNSNFLVITLKSKQQIILDNGVYSNNGDYTKTFISTSKPIYKPGETVEIFASSRTLTYSGYKINSLSQNINIYSPNYKILLNKNISFDKNGIAKYSFVLDKDASLGNYNLSIGNENIYFAVEEYVKPDFKIEANTTKDFYLSSGKAQINLNGKYYSDFPLSNGTYTTSITKTDFRFSSDKFSDYDFGENNYNFWTDYFRFTPTTNYENGPEGTLDENGNATLEIYTDENKDQNYLVNVTLTDPNTKKSVTKQVDFKSIKSPVFVGIKTDKNYYNFGNTLNYNIVSLDFNSNIVPSTKTKVSLYKVDYTQNKNTYEITPKETLVNSTNLITNNNGIVNGNVKLENYGEYKLEITNDFGYKTIKKLYVSGGNILLPTETQNKVFLSSDKTNYNIGDILKLNITSVEKNLKALVTIENFDKILDYKIIDITDFNTNLDFEIKKEYLPNFNIGVVEISDTTDFESQKTTLEQIRKEMLELEQKLIKEENIIPYKICDIITLPQIKENYNTTDLLKLANLRAKEFEILQKVLPRYYKGDINIAVNTDTVSIDTQITLDKINYLPGDKAEIILKATDNIGTKISGIANIKIIDEALLALKNNKTDILKFFYDSKPNYTNTFTTLENIISRIDFEKNYDYNSQNYFSPYANSFGGAIKGMGGAIMTESAAMDSSTMSKNAIVGNTNNTANTSIPRENFQDLAFYKGTLEFTNGEAKIIIDKLPDNLTSWAIYGNIITSDTKVGEINKIFQVKKDVYLINSLPNFLLGEDKANMGTVAVNNSSTDINAKITLNIFNKNYTKDITIKAKTKEYIEFEINTPNVEENAKTDVILNLNTQNYSDTIKQSIPVYPNFTTEYTFTNGKTKDISFAEKLEIPDEIIKNGSLEISIGTTVLTNLIDNLKDKIYFPYDDFNSKITILKNINELENIYKKIGKNEDFKKITLTNYLGNAYSLDEIKIQIINSLPKYLQKDFGFAYFTKCYNYNDTCSSLDLTGKYLSLQLEIPGIDNTKVYEYYKKSLETYILKQENSYINLEYFIPISLKKDSDFINKYLKIENNSLSNIDKLNYLEIFSNIGITNTNTKNFLQELKNSVFIEARGSVLPSNNLFSYGNNIYSSAKFLSILLENNVENEFLIGNLARYITTGNDAYYNDFTQVLITINKYLDKTKELENVEFTGIGYLNGKEIIKEIFTNDDKFTLKKASILLKDYIKNTTENIIGFEKTGTGNLYYNIGLKYNIPNNKITSFENGIIITREYFDYNTYYKNYFTDCFGFYRYYSNTNCNKISNIDSINSANLGDFIVGEITITTPVGRKNIEINDFIPAGTQIVNTNFDTTSSEVKALGNTYYFDRIEQKHDRVYIYSSNLGAGTYTYRYVLKATNKGKYSVKPATSNLIDTPEVWGRTKGMSFEIK